MQSCFRAIGLSLLLCTSLGGRAWSDPPHKYIPEGPGVIQGRAAIAVLSARYDSSSRTQDYFDPSGLEAHFTPADDPDAELVYPAGEWFQHPPGRYRVWLEGEWRMTPFSGLIIWGAPASEGGMIITLPVEEAGRVRLPPGTATAPHLDLHLLHAGSYLQDGFSRWEISRRKAAGEAGDGILMPAGETVGALWDRKHRRYIAISRPFVVRGGETVEIPLENPLNGAHLVAQLTRNVPGEGANREVNLTLVQKDGERAPDLSVFTADRVYAFWYDLAADPGKLRGASQDSYLASQEIDLQAGQIARVVAELKPRPALEVQLDLPSTLKDGKAALEVRSLPSGEVLAHHILEPSADTHRFERLPPALVQVEIRTPLGRLSRQIDLSSGEDGVLLLKPELITLTGTVYYGKKGHSAKLTFANASRETDVQSEEDGRYEVLLLEPVQTVSIELVGADRVPYFDFFRPAVAASQEMDFHLPDGDFRVRVLDAVSHRGIANASVMIRNTYDPRDEAEAPVDERKREKAVFQSTRTGATGEARLPPLRAGSLEIQASAEGYARMRQAMTVEIPDENADQTFKVLLEPVGDTVRLRLRLPNGAPAPNARVLLMDSLTSAGEELFSESADQEGRVELPRKTSGFLLARHPAAAFFVREWRPAEEDNEMEWAFPAAAGQPLVLRVKDASGTTAAANAHLALWVEGRRLAGRSLAWLTGAPPLADNNGIWIGNNLPRETVSVLAWSFKTQDEVTTDVLAAQAAPIAFPWPESVDVRVVE